MTPNGGSSTGSANCPFGCGMIFKLAPTGELTTLYNFCSQSNCPDGELPYGGLVQAANGKLYGTTVAGGLTGNGTVFEITAAGKLTTLYSFCSKTNCIDGAGPFIGLVQSANGNFYGTTTFGGVNALCNGGSSGCGTVFEISPTGRLTTLYSFCSQANCADGQFPEVTLVQGVNGNFYGTTGAGGNPICTTGCGTVFEITPTGKLTTLYTFCSQTFCADGQLPGAGLVQAASGNFYGTTSYGGSRNSGTVFEITPKGSLTTLYSFCIQDFCADGSYPYANLVQATNGNFYGTTGNGGAYNHGELFEITSAGSLTTLYDFCPQNGCVDGASPEAGLMQASDGNFYGTTNLGGIQNGNCSSGCGTTFELSIGLSRFVETVPAAGKVGASVNILGNDLTGSTRVSFNGTLAAFTVVSPTRIKTNVPAGATSGHVTVTTSSGRLKSNVPFRVMH